MTKVQPGQRKRQRTSKVRTGCVTCKARHVKCGEEKPECLQCTTTDRKCEGYSLAVSLWKSRPTVSVAKTLVTQAPSSNVFQTHELRSLRFFLDKTTVQIASPFSPGFWSRTVPSIAQHEPSIKHALIALSGFHEKFTSGPNSRLELGRSALKHYNVAIRELLDTERNKVSPVIGLLCCLLFFAAELLQGKLASAIQLFMSGRRIIHELRRNISQTVQPGLYHNLFQILKETFKRSEYHVMASYPELHSELSFNDCYGASKDTDIVPELAEEEFYPTRVAIFNSIPQATEELRRLAHGIVNRSCFYISSAPVDQKRLANWCTAFESLKQTIPKPYTANDKSTILGLEIWWRQVSLFLLTILDAPNSADLMWWDQHQARLKELLDYIEKLLRLKRPNSGNSTGEEAPFTPTFCMETGQMTHLVSIISRCRDPHVRRRALALMKLYNQQEGLLRCDLNVEYCQRTIDLEEGDQEVTCAADIPAEARIAKGSMQFHPYEPKIIVKYLIGSKWITDIMTWPIADD